MFEQQPTLSGLRISRLRSNCISPGGCSGLDLKKTGGGGAGLLGDKGFRNESWYPTDGEWHTYQWVGDL